MNAVLIRETKTNGETVPFLVGSNFSLCSSGGINRSQNRRYEDFIFCIGFTNFLSSNYGQQIYTYRPKLRIVVFDGEFPANVTPFQKIAEEKNLQIVFNPLDAFYTDHQVGLNNLEEELKKGVRSKFI